MDLALLRKARVTGDANSLPEAKGALDTPRGQEFLFRYRPAADPNHRLAQVSGHLSYDVGIIVVSDGLYYGMPPLGRVA